MRHASLKIALIGAAIIVLAKGGMAADITVHEPDGEGRVFVDVVGEINDEDFKPFKEKTDQIYPIGPDHPNKQLIVTLISYGGHAKAALQIGDQIRKRGMSTFVPGDRTCTSACALIWVAGRPRNVGDNSLIGFHATFDPKTRQETGSANAVVGAYLNQLGLGYNAIFFMTRAGPTSVEWLTPDRAKEFRVAWAMLQPPRANPIPPQAKLPSGVHLAAPHQVAWSKSAPQQALQQPAPAPPASPKPVCLTPDGTPEPCEGRSQQHAPVPQQAPPSARRTTSPQDDMGRFVSKVLGSTELQWKQVFASDGKIYRPPVLVLYRGATDASCGGEAQSAMGPFYCLADQTVYLDTSFFDQIATRFHGCGAGSKTCQFSQAYVIAHEVGHHVQNLLGILPKAQQVQRAAGSRAAANHIQVQVELQADCFAGLWANYENQYLRSQGQPPFIEPGDVESALRTAAATGDDTLRQAQGYVVPDSFTHGSPDQRQRWFNAGLQSGKVFSCNTFAAAQL